MLPPTEAIPSSPDTFILIAVAVALSILSLIMLALGIVIGTLCHHYWLKKRMMWKLDLESSQKPVLEDVSKDQTIYNTLTSKVTDEDNTYSHIGGEGEKEVGIEIFHNSAYSSTGTRESTADTEVDNAYVTNPFKITNLRAEEAQTRANSDTEEVYEDIPGSVIADSVSTPPEVDVSVNVSYEEHTGQEYYSEPSVETAIYTARKARKNGLPAGSTSPSASGHVQGNPQAVIKQQRPGQLGTGPHPILGGQSSQHNSSSGLLDLAGASAVTADLASGGNPAEAGPEYANFGLQSNIAYGIQHHSQGTVGVAGRRDEGINLHSNVAYMSHEHGATDTPMVDNVAYEESVPMQDNVAYLKQRKTGEGKEIREQGRQILGNRGQENLEGGTDVPRPQESVAVDISMQRSTGPHRTMMCHNTPLMML
jgi:hypothetical protein